MEKRTVAQWESRGGKYFFVLYEDKWGYGYEADGAAGGLGHMENDETAIAYVERPARWGRWLDMYQADANITPMRRTA